MTTFQLSEYQEKVVTEEARLRGTTVRALLEQYLEGLAQSLYNTQQETKRRRLTQAILTADTQTIQQIETILGLS